MGAVCISGMIIDVICVSYTTFREQSFLFALSLTFPIVIAMY